jgi:hypothetical protein
VIQGVWKGRNLVKRKPVGATSSANVKENVLIRGIVTDIIGSIFMIRITILNRNHRLYSLFKFLYKIYNGK